MFEEQSIDQSALKKLTEELSRTKKSEKVLAGKERASIRALYLPLHLIYFSNLSKQNKSIDSKAKTRS